MVELLNNDVRSLMQAIELLTDLHNRQVKGESEYVKGFVHSATGIDPVIDDGAYADGYAAGLVVQEARAVVKKNRKDFPGLPIVSVVKPENHAPKKAPDDKLMTSKEKKNMAILQGFTGNSCSNCGSSKMKRNGTCECCVDCGTSSGCS